MARRGAGVKYSTGPGLAQRVVPTHRAIWARTMASTGLVPICGRHRAQDAGSAGAHAPYSLWSSFAAQALRRATRLVPPLPRRLLLADCVAEHALQVLERGAAFSRWGVGTGSRSGG